VAQNCSARVMSGRFPRMGPRDTARHDQGHERAVWRDHPAAPRANARGTRPAAPRPDRPPARPDGDPGMEPARGDPARATCDPPDPELGPPDPDLRRLPQASARDPGRRRMNATRDAWHDAPMEIHFLGGATTVTGSQFLLVTDQARILIDCGMFQGGPNESVRNRVPLGFDPRTLDAILLTHAHLDHCGLIPHVIAEGFAGPVYATSATVELAELVLLDSG